MSWKTEMERIGALVRHDGHPKRPYFLLRSGLITDTFCDCSRLFEQPELFDTAAGNLSYEIRQKYERFGRPTLLLAPYRGGKTLADAVGHRLGLPVLGATWENADKKEMVLSATDLGPLQRERVTVLPGDDILSTVGSIHAAIRALGRLFPHAKISPFCFSIGNFTHSHEVDSRLIVSLFELRVKRWQLGENPHTPSGQELVPPVRPEEHWEEITRSYE